MHAEAAFLAGYALMLVAVAAGLESLGRRSTAPWASRMLAASRPSDASQAGEEAGWPHSELPGFHLGVSGVVLAAAMLLTVASIVRHHNPTELAVQLPLLVLILKRIVRLLSRHRAFVSRQDSTTGR